MTQNMADEIRNCELAAQKIISDAKKEASRILAAARTSAEQTIKDTKRQSHRYYREQVKIAEAEADLAAAKTMETGRKEAREYYDDNKSKTIYVADWLVGEVINSYGNGANTKNICSGA